MALFKVNNYNHFGKTIVLVATFFTVLHSGLALNNSSFGLRKGCICPQDVNNTVSLIYECTTVGSFSTIWKGSAFDCPGMGNEILLLHTQFAGGTRLACNDGNIVASSVGVDNQCFTSRLNVTYNPALLGATVMCTNGSTSEIGESTISVRTDPFPPPESITLSNIVHRPSLLLTFTWGPDPGCRALYTITSTCGNCATSIRSTETICHNVEVPMTAGGRVCTFEVRTDACGSIPGVMTNTLRVNLRFPDPPTVSVVPTYFQETGQLAGIQAEFMESEAFNITETMDGSATSYIIEYFDGSTDMALPCADNTVDPTSSCVNGLCTHFFDISSSRCNLSAPISVAVSAENRLGRGMASTPILIREITNEFVMVTIDLMSAAVICNFQQSSADGGSTIKTCSIVYEQTETCDVDDTLRLSQVRQFAQDTSNSVIIGFPFVNQLSSDRQTYCFVVNATNGTYTGMIRGTFNTGCDLNRLYDGSTVSSPAEGATCDPPLNYIGTSDGYACYSGTLVGAYAVHRCLNCDYRSVRVCMADGNWNGTALQCDCSTTSPSQSVDITLPIALGVVIVILIALLVLFIALIGCLALRRRKTKARIAQLQRRVTELSSVYEELDPRASILLQSSTSNNMETTDNKAYSVPRKATPKLEVSPGEAYEIMRSVSHKKDSF